MKKLTFVLLLLFISIITRAQYVDYNKISWTGSCDNKEIFYEKYRGVGVKDSIISIIVQPISDSNTWNIIIINHSNDKIIVKWDGATIGNTYSSTRVLFGTMRRYQINDPMQPSVIHAGLSLDKKIIGQEYAENAFYNLASKKAIKKRCKENKTYLSTRADVVLVIPIEYKNKEYIYRIEYTATCSPKK